MSSINRSSHLYWCLLNITVVFVCRGGTYSGLGNWARIIVSSCSENTTATLSRLQKQMGRGRELEAQATINSSHGAGARQSQPSGPVTAKDVQSHGDADPSENLHQQVLGLCKLLLIYL